MIASEASLPRPWWALLTVYVTAQPMAGATRRKRSTASLASPPERLQLSISLPICGICRFLPVLCLAL